MRKLTLVVVVIVSLILVGITGCSSNSSSSDSNYHLDASSPEITVRGFLEAYNDGDLKAMIWYWDGSLWGQSVSDSDIETAEELFGSVSPSFTIREIELVFQENKQAEVRASYDVKMMEDGNTQEFNTVEIFKLEKTSDKWIIIEEEVQEIGSELNAEMGRILQAMEKVMVENNVTLPITPQTTWTNDMTIELCNGCISTISDYLEDAITTYYYQWDEMGLLMQCKDTNCPDPF